MTTEASARHTPPAPEPPPQSAKCDAVIDDRLRKTRLQVKGVDIAAGLLTLGIGIIGYLFVLALADHWLVSGGLGFWTRLIALVTLAAGSGVFAYFKILRPLLLKINPVFVAHTIEENQPSLKNSLINFLLLRGGPHGLSAGVYRAVEGQAANDLSRVSPEAVIDRRHVVWLAAAFVALVAVGGLYHIASPKNPLTSAFRIAWPWTAAAAPTRVSITEITPGDTEAFFGQTITVAADVSGVAAGEPVTLFFDTADGQTVGEAIPMRLPEGAYRHRCELPPGKLGLRQNLQYYLSAGDCKSRKFTVAVQTPPVIEIERIDYHYPLYTGIPDRPADRQGGIRAIEGTEITIHATANRTIQNAEIDLNCDGLRGLRMSIDDKKATGRFKLRMRQGGPVQPLYDCYQLRFSDKEGRENHRPIRYEIDVIADLPPRVELKNPPQEHIQLPAGGSLQLQVEAEDADYALRKVAVRAESDGRGLPIRAMLNKVAAEQPHKGPFAGTYSFEPAALGLKPGDQIVYWAEATDNKSPLPNIAETERRWITIVEPADEQQQQENQDQNDQNQQGDGQKNEGQQGEGQQGEEQQGEGQQGEEQQGEDQQQGEGQQGEGQQGEGQQDEGQQGEGQQGEEQQGEGNPSEPIDGESNPGDVFDNAMEHMEKEKKEKREGEQKPGEQKPGEQKPGEGEKGEQKPGEQQPGEGEKGEQKPGEQQPGEGEKGEQKPGEQQPGEGEKGDKGEQQEGEREKSDRKDTENQGEQGQEGLSSGRNPSDQAAADEPPSETKEPGGDEFNKQYADKVTNLVLEEFEKQLAKKKPDQELLDSLGGWTRKDLERFTKRWQAMKKAAKQDATSTAKHDLDNALRSLGLNPSKTDLRGGTRSDDLQRMRTHRRIAPPRKWAPQTRAYKQSIESNHGNGKP
jgi:hypothetical protein